ncbi:MAG: hypothetical protein M3126_04870 [Candidatus Eremiobacteraeota bacterium]|nr:hypothetical protein [Candidatus Eremiobacteraeota bacterium]
MRKDDLAARLLAVMTRMVTFFRADEYRAAKFGLERAIVAGTSESFDLDRDDESIMREMFDRSLGDSALLKIERKTKALDLASIGRARDILSESFREELPE